MSDIDVTPLEKTQPPLEMVLNYSTDGEISQKSYDVPSSETLVHRFNFV